MLGDLDVSRIGLGAMGMFFCPTPGGGDTHDEAGMRILER
jgi:hypothetical protein